MELLSENEVLSVVKTQGHSNIVSWSIENYSDKLIGYLGDHLRLNVTVKKENAEKHLQFFVKCMPRLDKWKAKYLTELNFFYKEYIMLSQLFKQFADEYGISRWRPDLLFIRKDLFIFEDVSIEGYVMPNQRGYLSFEEITATVYTLAKFHAQSYILEEKKSIELNRPYRIWEDYSEYLQEPPKGQPWRDAGRNAVIDFLKVYSSHRSKPNFIERIQTVIPMLFEGALASMTPSVSYRNAVIHRDLWANNIFLKRQVDGKLHALIVDFQTVLYSSPMLDLSSVLFLNTTKQFRSTYTDKLINVYYETLSIELKMENIDIKSIFDKPTLMKCYEESVMFGITQAAIIVPIVAMSTHDTQEVVLNPDTSITVDVFSRNKEIIKAAEEDKSYHLRVLELFDDIVERYVYPNTNSDTQSNI